MDVVNLKNSMKHIFDTIIKLSISNYSICKLMIEDILYCKDLHKPIEDINAKPNNMSNSDRLKTNRKINKYIR